MPSDTATLAPLVAFVALREPASLSDEMWLRTALLASSRVLLIRNLPRLLTGPNAALPLLARRASRLPDAT